MLTPKYGILFPAINLYIMPNTEEEEISLGVSPPGIFISSVKTSGDEIKFTLKSGCLWPKNVKLFLSDFNESNRCTFNIQSGKPDRSSKSMLYKVWNWYFFYSHALQFPYQSMRIRFPSHFVGISSHFITCEWNSQKMSWEWKSHKPYVGIVSILRILLSECSDVRNQVANVVHMSGVFSQILML